MTERAADRLARKYEVEDIERLRRALERVEADADLRFMLWNLLDGCGMFQNPFTGNALTTSFNSGKMSVGQELMELCETFTPTLFPTLFKEMTNERTERQRNIHDRLRDRGD